MSEAMALERMTELLAEMEGYLTATRVPYMAKHDASGAPKTENQLGDLDVVGIGPRKSPLLMVAECKGYGSPDDYQSWLTPAYLGHLHDLVWSPAKNIARVAHIRWGEEFRARKHRPDEIWVVFPGTFHPRGNPAKWNIGRMKTEHRALARAVQPVAQGAWSARKSAHPRTATMSILAAAEQQLAKDPDYNGIKVRLLPVHVLLEKLFCAVAKDMGTRRKRYPDTSMEMIRWLARAIGKDAIDLSVLQTSIVKVME